MNAYCRADAPPAENQFERLYLAGYRRLVPIVPPGAPISPDSTLFRALSKGPEKDPRGKAVGIRRDDGLWCGFNWTPYIAVPEDAGRWHAMGAGVGIKTGAQHDGTWLLAIDADTLDGPQASLIQSMIERHFGEATARHTRIGRAPKALYLIRVAEPFAYTRVEFEQGDGKNARVEILSDGRQFVAEGVHPLTKRPYDWPHVTPDMGSVLITTPAAVNAFMAALQGVLPACKPMVVEGAASDVDQAKLRGDPEQIRRAVEATPNTPALFPEREDYLHFGYAIKAALPDDPQLAFELFSGWCDKYVGLDGETNSDEEVSSDWRRMKAPYKVGASYVFRKAEEHSGGAYSSADRWFEEQAEVAAEPLAPANPWQICAYFSGSLSDPPLTEADVAAAVAQGSSGAPAKSELFEMLTLGDLFNRKKPVFIVERHIPEASLGFLYGDPGTGKSFIALDLAMHLAFGLPSWHGDRIAAKPDGAVVYLTGGEGTAGMVSNGVEL